MVGILASLIADIIVSLILGVLELCLHILIAAVKPWRYLLSRSFRTAVNAQHAQIHPFLKWWYLFWGTTAVLASITIIAAAVLFVSAPSTSRAPESSEHRHVLHQIARVIIRKAIESRAANQ
jgi:hypothetical protein